MKPIRVRLTDNEIAVDLSVRPATLGDSLRREMLVGAAISNPLKDPVEQTAAVVFYPRCLAVTSGEIYWPGHTRQNPKGAAELAEAGAAELAEALEARDLTPAEFVSLPEAITDAWWKAVIETNPRWALKTEKSSAQAEQDQKKG